jgi:filamentous hemagglutinin family protein
VSKLAPLALLAALAVCVNARAQVATDGSLGAAGPVAGGLLPDGTTATYRIDESLGQRRGGNLFQSFSVFSLPAGTSAAFLGEPSIDRVIARVTGGISSAIDGRLRNTIEGADLYLINPQGVFFGASSSLDLRGSLYVTTADTLRLADGSTFSTTPTAGEVLAIAPPSAYGFGSDDFGLVRFSRASNLAVPDGETISVAAGDVVITGTAVAASSLRAGGGSIELAARKSAGEIPVEIADFDVSGAAPGELGTIQLGANARLSVSDSVVGFADRGRIVIRGGTFVMDGAQLLASSAASALGDVPDVDIATSESVALRGGSLIANSASGSALGGELRVASPRFDLTGGAVLQGLAFDDATGGGIQIETAEASLSGGARIASGASADATAGQVELTATSVAMAERAQVSSQNASSRGALGVSIDTDRLDLIDGARIVSTADGSGEGAALRIRAGTLEQASGGRIDSFTTSPARGGDVEIHGAQLAFRGASASFDPGGVFATSFGAGTAGSVFISAESLSIESGAQLSATTQGPGDAGDVGVEASDAIRIAGIALSGPSGIFARSGLGPEIPASGDSGNISIRARTLEVDDGSEISVAAFGDGAAGSIRVAAEESVRISGGDHGTASINSKAQDGVAGNLTITTPELLVNNDGQISASTFGVGDAGDIIIEARRVLIGGGDPVRVEQAGIFARAGSFGGISQGGDGGDITIRAQETVEVREGGRISVETRSVGTGGTIYVEGAESVNIADGTIGATTNSAGQSGNVFLTGIGRLEIGPRGAIATTTDNDGGGGHIVVVANGDVSIANGGRISASTSLRGDAGNISIRAARIRVGGGPPSDGTVAAISSESLTPELIDLPGRGGDVVLQAARKLEVSDGAVISVRSTGGGDAGKIEILHTDIVGIHDGQISATSEGTGAGGSIALTDVDELRVGRDGLITSETLASGTGGAIQIDANREVELANGGAISARSSGTGDAGRISIDAGQLFTARDGGRVTTEASVAAGGSIDIRARKLLYIRDGEITTSVAGDTADSNGGNITLDPQFVVLDHANVIARAVGGNGGNILIQTEHFVPDVSSIVDASSELGIDGEIQITSPGIDLTSELATLDTSFLDASSQLARACASRSGQRGTFVVRGSARTASPDAPLDALGAGERETGCAEPTEP